MKKTVSPTGTSFKASPNASPGKSPSRSPPTLQKFTGYQSMTRGGNHHNVVRPCQKIGDVTGGKLPALARFKDGAQTSGFSTPSMSSRKTFVKNEN